MADEVLNLFPSVGHLTRIIDATLLRPEAVEHEYVQFLKETKDGGFRCAVVPLYYLLIARLELEESGIALGTVIGFPLGSTSSDTKKSETVLALQHGADELDMVVNISALRSGRYQRVKEDIDAVVSMARRYDSGKGEGHIIVKVILETGYLNSEEIRKGALLAREAGADFVKTSTGFGPGGATVEDVAYLRKVVGPGFGVKASGGIRDLQGVMDMVNAGANRIGTSRASEILQEYLRIYPWK